MAKLTVFEIHTHRNGAWKIDSIFDDRELAVEEAQRIERSQRLDGVRVVEETFDEETEKVGTRTVYRSAKAQEQTDAKGSPAEASLGASRRRRHTAPRKKSMVEQILGKTLLLVAIIFGSLGLIYLLNSIL